MTCMYAEWKKTAAGRLHPSGTGKCLWPMPTITLPKSRYYSGDGRVVPRPWGGMIERKDESECSAYEEDFP
jgi:hypothetical protein